MKVLRETQFDGLTPSVRGKVRDIYDLGDKLLIVATDRLSAFDVILPTPRTRAHADFPFLVQPSERRHP